MQFFEGGGDLDAEAGLALGDDRKAEADDHDAEVEEPLAFSDRFSFVADHDWNNGGGRIVKVEAELGETVADPADVGMEFLDPLRLPLDDFDCFFGAGRDGGREGVGKEAGAGALLQDFEHVRRGGDVAASGAAEGFAERAGEDVDLAVNAEVLRRAAAGGSKDTDAV